MGLDVHGGIGCAAANDAARQTLEILGLGHRLHYHPSRLSGGQKQRVAVARALVGNPEIVLADEPTAALDRAWALTVVETLKALGRARGTTTLMVTHDPRIRELADRVIDMEEGRVVGDHRPPGDVALT